MPLGVLAVDPFAAYRHNGYRLAEIADDLGVHAATVSRRLTQAEQVDV